MKKIIIFLLFFCIAYPSLAAYNYDETARKVKIMTALFIGLVYLLAIIYSRKKKAIYLIGLLLMYFIIFICIYFAFEDITVYDGNYKKNDIIIELFSRIFILVIIFLPLFNIIFTDLITIFKNSKSTK